MFCAWCGSQVATTSFAPCPRCGRPTNGARTVPPASSGSNAPVVIILVVISGFVAVGILGILAAIAIPNLLTAMQRSKQARTIADIRSLATATKAYREDNNGYPNVTSADALGPFLTPKYMHTMPSVDGWGHPFLYFCTKKEGDRCTKYVIGSGGKDGMFEHSDPAAYLESPPGGTKDFNCDLIYSNGEFVEYPEGIQH